ncbi:MAG: 16S rRNA (guanine(527)-N(7))-methyltransferase RsmG [Muribaculaceae bacterium]|nr:16S rRNA (guanine(527)-N(7))-methyltransferase RsmG [Muribaculaceae bacterium]MDE6533743.1 16S rRNA (guanine(527)-N(7))-methyltransferase RsmG [Muribaculaceae bacterium]
MTDLISHYFPSLCVSQKTQFLQLTKLYPEWNEKINVISRKDIDNIEVNHILHSLAIAKFINFSSGSHVLDFGSGGGLPGIPLAVFFPDVHFHLIDRIGKKIRVAKEIAKEIGLDNISFQHGDSGECHDKFDFVVSRAVMPQPDLVKLARKNVASIQRNAIPNGIITLKGGDLNAELRSVKESSEVVDIAQYFKEPFFTTKKIVYTIV